MCKENASGFKVDLESIQQVLLKRVIVLRLYTIRKIAENLRS